MNTITESPARARLAAIVADRESKLAEVERLRLSAFRLASAPITSASIEAELKALDAAETAQARAWAEAEASGNPPAPNVKLRKKLESDLIEARAREAAARTAQLAIESERVQLNADAGRVNGFAAEPVAEILIESAAPIVAEFKRDFAALAKKRELIARAFMTVRDLAEKTDPNQRSSILRGLEPLSGAMVDAGVTLNELEFGAKFVPPSPWTALAGNLHADASAKLQLDN